MANQNLAFTESTDALEIRIQAHRLYSSMQLESVLEKLVVGKPNFHRICDLGCGNGNFTELFASRASLYLGLDINSDLLNQASHRARARNLQNALFMLWDMSAKLPMLPNSFDFIFSGFSAYYVKDAETLVRQCVDLIGPGGEIMFVGPTLGNAEELDFLGKALFGVASTAEKDKRMTRLQTEFFPTMQKCRGNSRLIEEDFSLVFPNAKEYVKYYKATPQFLELARAKGAPDDSVIEKEVLATTHLRLTKKTVFLTLKKQD